MINIRLFARGNYGLLKTFLLSHVALLCYFICAEIFTKFMQQRRGELEDVYAPLYFIAVLELLTIYLLVAFWNAIKKYDGKKVWIFISKSYAFFVLQCLMAPLYFIGYLYYI
jgi:hypothetical protein